MDKKYCLQCDKEIIYNPYKDRKNKFITKKYCSNECYFKTIRVNLESKYCKQCNKLLEKHKDERPINFKRREYCSIQCSNKSRIIESNCPNCGKLKSITSKHCNECNKIFKRINILNKTLEEVTSNNRNKYAQVRDHAVLVMNNSNIKKECKLCGFKHCIEVHHIKPISSFNKDDIILDINSLDNLIYLCPNHHAMADKGLIKL